MPAEQLDILAVYTTAELPCLDHDPELFFAADPAEVEAAKLVCQSCPLIEECLEGALRRQEPHGVWGGQLFIEGVIVARKRPRGRPRKHPLPQAEPTRLDVRQSVPVASRRHDKDCPGEGACVAA